LLEAKLHEFYELAAAAAAESPAPTPAGRKPKKGKQ
jgi:hypothetical protein